MTGSDEIITLLTSIDGTMKDLIKMMVQENKVAPQDSISQLARSLSLGDKKLLKQHNANRKQSGRFN